MTQYLSIPGYPSSPAFSDVALIPRGGTVVLIGGQNAVSEHREIVGKGDAVLQAEVIRGRIDAALRAAGCTWNDVFRVQVHMLSTVDPRSVFAVFQSVLSQRTQPPLVGVYKVQALANPDFLIEVSVEALQP